MHIGSDFKRRLKANKPLRVGLAILIPLALVAAVVAAALLIPHLGPNKGRIPPLPKTNPATTIPRPGVVKGGLYQGKLLKFKLPHGSNHVKGQSVDTTEEVGFSLGNRAARVNTQYNIDGGSLDQFVGENYGGQGKISKTKINGKTTYLVEGRNPTGDSLLAITIGSGNQLIFAQIVGSRRQRSLDLQAIRKLMASIRLATPASAGRRH